MEDLAEKYAKLRMEDESLGTRDAARQAGYSSGVPSAKARRLYDKARLASSIPSLRKAVISELAELECRAEKLREEIRQKREWLVASTMV